MVAVRVDMLLGEVLPLLQKACTIAVRYAVVRRQSRLRPRQEAPLGPTVSAPRLQPSARVGCQEHT